MSILQMLRTLCKRDGRDFISSLYKEILNRDPDEEGLQFHLNLLNSGMTKLSIMSGMFQSNEARTLLEMNEEQSAPEWSEDASFCNGRHLEPHFQGTHTSFRYIVGIPFINRLDLLYQALASVPAFDGHIFVIDNSKGSILANEPALKNLVSVYTPPVPLTFSQSMNMIQKVAYHLYCDVMIYMHVDAEAHQDTPETFLRLVEDFQAEARKWGVVMTNYDTIAAYSMRAADEIGPWDTVLPNYFTDWDYYKRLKVAGYERIETGLPVIHHNGGSSSYKSDSEMEFMVRTTYPLYLQYFEAKWGPNQSYTTPFNR